VNRSKIQITKEKENVHKKIEIIIAAEDENLILNKNKIKVKLNPKINQSTEKNIKGKKQFVFFPKKQKNNVIKKEGILVAEGGQNLILNQNKIKVYLFYKYFFCFCFKNFLLYFFQPK
jgi:hypothetical protein